MSINALICSVNWRQRSDLEADGVCFAMLFILVLCDRTLRVVKYSVYFQSDSDAMFTECY